MINFKPKKILFYSLSFILFYAVLELFLLAVISIKYKSHLTPVEYFELLTNYNWDKNYANKCNETVTSYLNRLGPHPYLGYTMWNSGRPDCANSRFGNNENFNGPDFPKFKDEKFFTILLIGGSVADQLGGAKNKDGGFFAEDFLNSRFAPADGRKFKILNAALGDYRMPQNLIALLLYHDVIDGVIDLSGYNESHNYFNNSKLEEPSPNYWGLFDLEIKNELSQKRNDVYRLAQTGSQNLLCSNSYICITLLQLNIQHKMEMLVDYKTQHTPRYSSQKRFFEYTVDVPLQKKMAHRKQKHLSYMRLLNGMCSTLKINCSFFIQPIPQIGKNRVAEEYIAIRSEQSRLADVYADLSSNLMTLKRENVDIYNLSHIFAGEKGRIYADHIHYYIYPGETVSRGNQLVWKEITEKIGVSWQLKRK